MSTAQAYCAALQHLGTLLAQGWAAVDWRDRTLCWRFYSPRAAASPEQGWKVHVSTSAAESPQLLAAVADELAGLGVPFKLPRRIDDVVFLNSGDAGAEQLGKILTLYPCDDRKAREVIVRLDRVWPTSRGPEVQTDLHVRPGSAVSFRYGVFRAGARIVGSTGTHEFALTAPDGSQAPDLRLLGGEQSPLAPPSPWPGCPPDPCPLRLDQPVRIGGFEYVALAQLADTPRARTFLAADLGTLDTVVIKAGRRGVAGDLVGRDIRDLLAGEFMILRGLETWPDVAPRALQWHDGDWPLLVMEDFRGELLCELPRRARIAGLPLLADAVATLHEAGFVHGDIKLENAVRRGAGVGLIDFELAARLGEPMRRGGTRGHLAPEVDGPAHVAHGSRDVFALAGCVVQAVLDTPPGLLPAGAGRLMGILHNENATEVARLVAPWLRPDPGQRPSARSAAQALHAGVGAWRTIVPDEGGPSSDADRRWQRRASADAAQLVGSFAITGPQGSCWRNEHFMRTFECEAINIGAAGIVIGLLSIDRALGRSDHRAAVDEGARWLASRPVAGNSAGLFTGNAGVAIALALAGLHLRKPDYLAAARRRFEAAAADRREIDLFSGAAGVVWAACLLRDLVADDWPLQMVRDVVEHIGAQADSVAELPVWAVDPAHDVCHLGCAHGSAGIAMALACWGRASGELVHVEHARDVFRRLVCHGRTDDGAALRIGPRETRHHAVGNWCHGVAGTLWALLNGLGDDPALRTEIDWAVAVLADSMSVGTPTYCHGLAGQLELWHLVEGVPRFRGLAQARAGKVARALRTLHVKVDGRCTWTSDDPDIVTPDLWIGFLGPATALAMHAGGIRWPLLSSPWLSACAQPAARRSPRPGRSAARASTTAPCPA